MHHDVDPKKVCNLACGSASPIDAAVSAIETCAADETSSYADETSSRRTASESWRASPIDAAVSAIETCAADETSSYADETSSRRTASESWRSSFDETDLWPFLPSVDAMGAASIDDDIRQELNNGSSLQKPSVRRDVSVKAPSSFTNHPEEVANAQCVSTVARSSRTGIRIENQASGNASRQRFSGTGSSWIFANGASCLPSTADFVPCERFQTRKINAKGRRFLCTRHPLWVYRDDEFSDEDDDCYLQSSASFGGHTCRKLQTGTCAK
eukprot:TRINITY_DN4978_c0_g1_i5.p1 TRINITY_DN4978_c0_g1~~TRINITY_DN4978_c0_g1_i5.p1  ORF type:complete len:270 (+),score=39.53 TRINITY_DN4978_c0_g1_i5:149-958(+)